jgi:hypothetical protein
VSCTFYRTKGRQRDESVPRSTQPRSGRVLTHRALRQPCREAGQRKNQIPEIINISERPPRGAGPCGAGVLGISMFLSSSLSADPWHSRSPPKDSQKRSWRAIACLAVVLSRLDVVAVQKSRRNPVALRRLSAGLGPHWQVDHLRRHRRIRLQR